MIVRTLRASRRRGGALVAALVLVVVCAALAGSTIMTNLGQSREATSDVHRERALAMAEAGLDWGVSEVRDAGISLPTAPASGVVPTCGDWNVRYLSGAANGRDDDGDGTVDEPTESVFSVVIATGHSGSYRRTLELLLFRPMTDLGFSGATQFNVDAPILDVSGNSFRISGEEHLIDGSIDPTRPARYGIASPADPDVIIDQVPPLRLGAITGMGGTPSVGQVPAIDLNAISDQAARAATIVLAPGTHASGSWGTPVVGQTEVLYCDGDLMLSSGTSGAGILVVDGDLTISGSLDWIGVILVRGRTTMVGGGGTKRLIGTLVVGEEVDTMADPSEVTISGTVDLLYSTDAVVLVSQALSIPLVAAWREVGTP